MWDFPRPPSVRPTPRRIRVVHHGVTLADTTSALMVCETSQAPAYYLPPADVRVDLLTRSAQRSWCEWKGQASYWALDGAEVAWSYERPTPGFEAIAGSLAFYPQRVEECWVDDERVAPNGGDFYGGWITSHVTGPFKGAPGTRGW